MYSGLDIHKRIFALKTVPRYTHVSLKSTVKYFGDVDLEIIFSVECYIYYAILTKLTYLNL